MAFFRFLLAVSFATFMLGSLGACGNDGEEGYAGGKVRILEFSADPETVVEGDSTTLRWSTQNAVSVVLLENGINRVGGRLPAEGSVVVTPGRDSSYRLEAEDADGNIAEASLEVGVEPFGLPRIEKFVASPEVVSRGNAVTLSWEVVHAESVELVSELGGRIAVFAPAERLGSYAVQPNDSTKYVLRARNASGVVTEEVGVIVGKRPTIALELNASEVVYGEEVELRWTVTGAETLTIFDVDDRILHDGAAENGSIALTASHSGVVRAVAQGFGGKETAEIRLEVEPLIEEFQVQIHADSRPGSKAVASWKVRGAERVVVSDGLYDLVESYEEDDFVEVRLGTAGFVLRAYSGSTTATRNAIVQVVEKPLIRKISTGPLVTAGQGVVGMSPIGWEIDGAARLQLEVEPGGVVDLVDKSPRLDEVDVLFIGPGTITLTAFNGAGSTTVVIPSPVDPVPTIAEFFSAPSRAGMGEQVEIHWETISAETIVLEREGVELNEDPFNVSGKHLTKAPITGPTSFVLRAKNTLGHEVVSDPIVVETGPPNQLHFGTRDGHLLHRVNTVVDLVWQNDGGTSLTVENTRTGEVECTISDYAQIRNGSCPLKMPDKQEDIPLLLTVTNASGTDSRTLDLQAVTGPIIVAFDTPEFEEDEPAEITEGDSVLFSWEVLPDAEFNFPVLSLKDDRGVEYEMEDVTGEKALLGTKRFRIHDWGAEPRIFTLTATSAVPPAYSLSTKVMVYGIPTVDAMGASPSFAEDEGDIVNFTATTTHAKHIELYHLAEDGTPAGSPFFSTLNPDDAPHCETTAPRELSCNVQVVPTIAQPNVRLVAINPLGVEKEADFRIGVNPATVSSFTANGFEAPATIDILMGDEVVFEWETLRTTNVELREDFASIKNLPGTIDLAIPSYTTVKTLDFPNGFEFPHDGEVFSSVRVPTQGWISFDLTAEQVFSVVNLPSTTATVKKFDFLAFWADLNTSNTGAQVLWHYFESPTPHLVIEWSNVHFFGSTTSDFSFQMILFPDGRVEYRYGEMIGLTTSSLPVVIGAQDRLGDNAHVIKYGTASSGISGGFDHRAFIYEGWDGFNEAASTPRPTPPTGTWTVTPALSRTYTLKAWNGHSEHTESIEVRVHPKSTVEVWAEPAEPAPGEPATLHWVGHNLTSLKILDENGNLLRTATSAELEGGSLSLGALPQGIYGFKLEAEGMVDWDTHETEFVLSVFPPFDLVSFTSSETILKLDQPPTPITLSWEITNGVSATITELPGGQVTAIPAHQLENGSMQFAPDRTTTYRIDVESHERYRDASVEVVVRRVWIDDFQASPLVVSPGGNVTLTWSASQEGDHTIMGGGLPIVLPFAEGGESFSDISDVGTLIGSSGSARPIIDLPANFSFPFFGQEKTSMRVHGTGMLSFATGTDVWKWTVTSLPNTGEPDIHIAALWADMDTNGSAGAGIYGRFFDGPDPHYVIQWNHWKPYSPGTGDMNFQVVLYASGDIEYRYGSMSASPNLHMGASGVSIGLQEPGGHAGTQLHYGPGASDTIAGGLVDRAWRWTPRIPISNLGSMTANPRASSTYEVCVSDGIYEECQTVDVTVQ